MFIEIIDKKLGGWSTSDPPERPTAKHWWPPIGAIVYLLDDSQYLVDDDDMTLL